MQPARVNEGRIGLLVLGQVPTLQDLLGFALVIAGVALHQDREQGAGRVGSSIGGRPACSAVELDELLSCGGVLWLFVVAPATGEPGKPH